MLRIKEIIEYRQGNSSEKDLAIKHLVSRVTINKWLKTHCVPSDRRTKNYLSDQQLADLANKKSSQRKLATEMKRSKSAIGKAFARQKKC